MRNTKLYKEDYVLVNKKTKKPLDYTTVCHISYIAEEMSDYHHINYEVINNWTDRQLIDFANKVSYKEVEYMRIFSLKENDKQRFIKEMEDKRE